MIYLTRVEHFNAAHKLVNTNWSEEQNLAVFGKCANANWHGHNYDLFVTIKGVPDPITGFCMDLKDLSKIINSKVIDKLDHKRVERLVNLVADHFFGQVLVTDTDRSRVERIFKSNNLSSKIFNVDKEGITEMTKTEIHE